MSWVKSIITVLVFCGVVFGYVTLAVAYPWLWALLYLILMAVVVRSTFFAEENTKGTGRF